MNEYESMYGRRARRDMYRTKEQEARIKRDWRIHQTKKNRNFKPGNLNPQFYLCITK